MTATAVAVRRQTTQPPKTWRATDLRAVRLSEPGSDGFARSWIMYAPQGRFHHPEYGDLNFTRAMLSEFKRHFDDRTRGIDIALDCDHKAGEAPGWIERLELREGSEAPGLYALVRWTPLGVQLLKEQRYRYFSPEFGAHFDEASGKKVPNVILGGALTNRPFLKSMEPVTLAEGAISRRPWSQIDKDCLPRSAFLIQGDPDHPTTWRLPVYEGVGPKDADGRYTRRGPLNLNGVRAALQAIHGARTGTPMSGVPAGTVGKLQRWLTLYGGSDNSTDSAGARQRGGGVKAAESTRRRQGGSGGRGNTMADVQYLDGDELDEEEGAMLFADGGAAGDASASDEEAYADSSADDEEAYDEADGDGDSDGDSAGADFDQDANTHGAMTTSGRGHSHGKFGLHIHEDDGDHSEAPLKMGAKKMREPAASAVRSLSEARRKLAETERENTQLREQAYRLEVNETMARLDKTFKFSERVSEQDDPRGESAQSRERNAQVAPSRRLREGLKGLLLNEHVRALPEDVRRKIVHVIEQAYERGAVPLTSMALAETERQPQRKVVLPGAAGRRSGLTVENGDAAVKLAEQLAMERHKTALDQLPYDAKFRLLNEAAAQTYKGAETVSR